MKPGIYSCMLLFGIGHVVGGAELEQDLKNWDRQIAEINARVDQGAKKKDVIKEDV